MFFLFDVQQFFNFLLIIFNLSIFQLINISKNKLTHATYVRFQRHSCEEIVEVLLSKHKVIEALQ